MLLPAPSPARVRFAVLAALLAARLTAAADGSATRDTALDRRLPAFKPPLVDLARYRSVQEREGQDPRRAVAVAISGGGHRAANFALGIMLELESFCGNQRELNILNEIDYFSTVSGGGFAAATYLAARFDHQDRGERGPFSLQQAVHRNDARLLEHLRRDYQASLLGAMFTPACYGYMDSGDILETRFDDFLLGAQDRPGKRSLILGDLFKPRDGGERVRLPFWVANATVYENGARFLFTPGVIEAYRVRGYAHRLQACTLKGGGFSLPLAVGMKASASFPVVIPATTFECRPRHDKLNPHLHLLDGGLTDNLGLETACELLEQDTAPRKVLIIIDAYKGVSHPYSNRKASPAGPEVAYRIMNISLDSAHAHLKRRIAELRHRPASEGGPVDVVVLSFDELKPALNEKIEDLRTELEKLRKEQARAILRRLRRELNLALKRGEAELAEAEAAYDLYDDARAVQTALTITAGQQQLLLRAGARAVESHRDTLSRLFE
jgi:hypothetical protein